MASIKGAKSRAEILARRTRRIATSELPRRSKLHLLTPNRSDRAVQVGEATVWLTRDSTDLRAFEEVILVQEYADADYVGATVLDIGAHKGYFGAYAILHGAHKVTSVEPAPDNLRYLKRAAASVGDPVLWRVLSAAVSDREAEARLRLSGEAWRHSLTHGDDQNWVSVRVVPMADLLARAKGNPLVVKIDAEGAEDEIVFGTPLELWARCHSVFVEAHGWAKHTHQQIAERLAEAGLMASDDLSGGVVRARRRDY